MNHREIKIKGFIPLSMLDWPGKMCSVIFLGGCNFRCPVCHNHKLVTRPDTLPDFLMDDVVRYLSSRVDWIDGVTVTGGEPTVNPCLQDLLELLAGLGFKVKLDTNGSNPDMLQKLITERLIAAVAMDIKSPLTQESYCRMAGVPINIDTLERSITIIRESGIERIFRTTVVPGLVAEEELKKIKSAIGSDSPYILQPFRSGDTLNPSFNETPEYDLARFEVMRELFENRTFHQ